MSEQRADEAQWVCAIVACASPMGEPHRPECPYAKTGNVLTLEMVRALCAAPPCDTCLGAGEVLDMVPGFTGMPVEGMVPCPDCSLSGPLDAPTP